MSVKEQPGTALTVRRSQYVEPWRGIDWQRLWLSLQAKPWRALALVPASRGGPADFTVTVAVTLARTGMVHLGTPIHVADGTVLELSKVLEFMAEIRHCQDIGHRILIALAPMEDNPITETLVAAADSALLCVMFETMQYGESKRTVNKIGKDRFLGSTIFRPDDPSLAQMRSGLNAAAR
jgi:hypothetical protein